MRKSLTALLAVLALNGCELTGCEKSSPWPDQGGDQQGRWEGLVQTSSTATLAWSSPVSAFGSNRVNACPTIDRANQMVVSLADGRIVAINPTNHMASTLGSTTDVVHGAVNVLDDSPIVTAIGTSTGTSFRLISMGTSPWSVSIPVLAEVALPSAPNSNRDKVFVSGDKSVFAYDRVTGALIKQTNVGDDLANTAGPAIAPEGDLSVVVATLHGHVVKLDPVAGVVKWDTTIPGAQFNNNVSIALNGTIFVRSFEGRLFVLAPDGTLNPNVFDSKTANLIGTLRMFGPAVATFGGSAVAYVADGNHKLTAVSDKGEMLWQVDLPDIPLNDVIAAGDTAYVVVGGTPNPKVLAVNKNGIRWSVNVPSQTCLAAGRDGLIYGVSGYTLLLTIKVG